MVQMRPTPRPSALVVAAVLLLGRLAAAQHPPMPAGMTHEEHLEQLKKDAGMRTHGARAMGFDQRTTTHHFRLAPDGGAIAVDVNRADDHGTREQIRAHLEEIAAAFRAGDFAKPFMTHGEQPPGVGTLQRLRADLAYAYEPTDSGGIVRIVTANPEALEALHAFLRYQIAEHATGDPLTVSKQ